MLPKTVIILMPDQLVDPIRIVTRLPDDAVHEDYASLTAIRTGEFGRPDPDTRRYELSDFAEEHPTDTVQRRFVIHEQRATEGQGDGPLPEWATRATALHPDRHDIADWFAAAVVAPQQSWVTHLSIVIRDALRNRDAHGPQDKAVLALPDRAMLMASQDNQRSALAPVISGFTGTAYALDESCHRQDILAPIHFPELTPEKDYDAIVTRAQAVIAEAIIDAGEAHPVPTVIDFPKRWAEIVNDDYANQLYQEDDHTFTAPLAILEDHRNRNKASIILATLRVRLGTRQPDVWLSYHTVTEYDLGRGATINLAAEISAGERTVDRDNILRAVQKQTLPVLSLSSRPDGQFAYTDHATDIPDAEPLFRDPLPFTYSQAILGLLTFRQPEAHDPSKTVSWRAVLAEQDGETDYQGAETDGKVADPEPPSSSEDDAPEQTHVGETDTDAHDTNHGSETGAGDGTQGEPSTDDDTVKDDAPSDAPKDDTVRDETPEADASEDGDIDLAMIGTPPDDDGDDDRRGGETGDPFGSSGQAALDPKDAQADGTDAESVGTAIANELHGQDGETDYQGAETDGKVADPEPPSSSEDDAPEQTHVGETDTDAHDTNHGSETGAGDGTQGGVVVLRSIVDDLTDSDQDILERIGKATGRSPRLTDIPKLPNRKELIANEQMLDIILHHLVTEQFTSERSASQRHIEAARALLYHEVRWVRMLFVLNILAVMSARQLERQAVGIETIGKAAKNAALQCEHTKGIENPVLPRRTQQIAEPPEPRGQYG